jgi:hypothetical protein
MTPKPINPAHVNLPPRPAGRWHHYQHDATEEDVRAKFAAKYGAAPDVVLLVNLSRTARPNACWIAGPVDNQP